ncbi:MAG: SAM-dependent chlorinase/fluorinase [Planctomycetota bacterium]
MPQRPIITLTTDFGIGSRYVAEMKGAILSINPDASIIDLTHAIPPQDIRTAAAFLANTLPSFPTAAIHVVVVDPGVGSDRLVIYTEIGDRRLVCPDNGLVSNLADATNPRKIVAIEEPSYWRSPVSPTFHGRDIMGPVAAHLSLGLPPERLGTPRAGLTKLAIKKATKQALTKDAGVAQRIEGEVIEVDSFGNLITNITAEQLADCPRDTSVTIRCDEHETVGIYQTYSEQPPMTLVAIVGSNGHLELAIVDDSAKIMLGVGVGAAVSVAW